MVATSLLASAALVGICMLAYGYGWASLIYPGIIAIQVSTLWHRER